MIVLEEYKLCLKCGESRLKFNSANICAHCHNTWNREYRRENRERVNKQKRDYRKRIKAHEREYKKDYYIINKEKIKYKAKERYERNKEEIKKRQREYYYSNKERINARNYQYNKMRRKSDVNFKLRQDISCYIGSSLRQRGGSKHGQSMLKHLQYSIIELRSHLESRFEPRMNWDNWGVYRVDVWDDMDSSTWAWQIDHIIPCSRFCYDSMNHPDFIKCWALNNLRPLSAKENIKRERR